MPRTWVVALLLICTALNGAGFLWQIFEAVPLYDEIAHLITPFTLVAITAEIVYRAGGDDLFFNTSGHALITGTVIGLVGAVLWELIEVFLDMMGVPIAHTIPDTIFDVVLGCIGGAAGAWTADHFLDRLFGGSGSHGPRVQ